MHAHYVFTTITGKKVIETKEFSGSHYDTPAERAERYALKLSKKLKKTIVAWCRLDSTA